MLKLCSKIQKQATEEKSKYEINEDSSYEITTATDKKYGDFYLVGDFTMMNLFTSAYTVSFADLLALILVCMTSVLAIRLGWGYLMLDLIGYKVFSKKRILNTAIAFLTEFLFVIGSFGMYFKFLSIPDRRYLWIGVLVSYVIGYEVIRIDPRKDEVS